MDTNDRMDDLLVKKLLEEATETEQKQVENWLKESSENERYFSHFKLIWLQSKELAAKSTVDEQAAWERFKERVEPQAQVIELHSRKGFGWLRIAAIFCLIAGASWLVYLSSSQNSEAMQITVKSDGQTLIDTLPDGSVITLNKRSSISYPKAFTKSATRQITLHGEAFFDVEPDKTKPFVITVNDVTVTVLGTSFNIKSNEKKTEVIVETGLVKVEKADQEIKVSPRESVTVLKEQKELVKKKNDDEFYNYYRTKKFICDNTPLWKLVETLNEAYGANIIIEGENLKNKQLNTTFSEQPLPEILRIIGETFDIKVEQNGDRIILK